MKLFEVPRNTHVRPVGQEEVLTFHRIDGMYSYCTDSSGNVRHLAAWSDVEIVGAPGQATKGAQQ